MKATFVVIVHMLRESGSMLWLTLWPLVLGLFLSGAVQAFVPRSAMRRQLGSHSPAVLVRASAYGMASSSCSYAASALMRSLVAKGADFVSATVFMVASTNLVIELGIVLVVLLGWQFAASEFVGGAIMIALLAVAGSRVFRSTSVALDAEVVDEGDASPERLHSRLRSTAEWSNAATYAVADFTMLRRELVAGYLIAGVLTVAVPTTAWHVLFLHGHGLWTNVENAVVAPLVAVLSFVCSVGNVPLAATLWHGGVSFGGVVSFIFADLITFPLLLLYRRYYGRATATRLFVTLWVVMAVAGFITGQLFDAFGWVPHSRVLALVPASQFSATTVLNVLALLLAGGLYWLSRNRERPTAVVGYAIDPVCGMQVSKALAPMSVGYLSSMVFFCSEGCGERFQAEPSRFWGAPVHAPEMPDGSAHTEQDLVCGMSVRPTAETPSVTREGETYWFCCSGCAETFAANPTGFLSRSN